MAAAESVTKWVTGSATASGTAWAAGAALAEPDDARLLEWRLELSSREALGDALTRLTETGYAAQTLPNGDALATDPWRTTVRLTLG